MERLHPLSDQLRYLPERNPFIWSDKKAENEEMNSGWKALLFILFCLLCSFPLC